jgi:hypothetical protein
MNLGVLQACVRAWRTHPPTATRFTNHFADPIRELTAVVPTTGSVIHALRPELMHSKLNRTYLYQVIDGLCPPGPHTCL